MGVIKNKIKRLSILLIVIIISVVVLIITFYLFFSVINVLEEIESPDGKYVAIIFERNNGALGNSLCLEVLEAGKRLNIFSTGNAYNARKEFGVYWIDDTTLFVNNEWMNPIIYDPNTGNSHEVEGEYPPSIYRQKTVVNGINIKYSRMQVNLK